LKCFAHQNQGQVMQPTHRKTEDDIIVRI